MKPAHAAPAALAMQRAAAAHARGNRAVALKEYRQVLKAEPANPVALRMLGVMALQEKKPAEAIAWLTRAVEQAPSDAQIHHDLGLAYRLAGEKLLSLNSFQQATALHPEGLESHRELSQGLIDLGELELAIRYLHELLEKWPAQLNLYLELAKVLARAGRAADAVDLLAAAANEFPPSSELYGLLGDMLAQHGNWDGAQACYAMRCELQPGNPISQHNWGISLQELGRTRDAIQAYERAIALNPKYATAYFSLGISCQKLDDFDAAMLAFDRAVELAPGTADFRIERARTWVKMGQFTRALGELENLPEGPRQGAEALNLKGIALKNLDRGPAALAAYEQAISARPDFVEAITNRANLLLLSRRFPAALADFNRAMALKPGADWLPGLRLYAALHIFDWTDFEHRRAALIEDVKLQRTSVQPLTLQCLVDAPQLQQRAAQIWSTHSYASFFEPGAVLHARPQGKIRIAYVSRDFRAHPVSYLMAEVFELHEREQFEVIALNYGPATHDGMQERLRSGFDRFLDVKDLSDAQIVSLARSLEVDIAVDLTGLTEGARGALFARRLAPVQIMYIGYLGTAGAPWYDYLIADPVIIPAELREAYDEKIIYLPSYQANDRQRPRPAGVPSRADIGLPEQGFVFCCFNNPSKVTPAVFAAWVSILQQVPASVLWVLNEDDQAVENLRRHAQDAGLDPQRIVFAKRSSREAYLANLSAADLFLDTTPYNAGATASDALWMGLPVLTQMGQSFAGRVAASLLDAAGLPELITHSTDDYVQTAVGLATGRTELAGLKQRLLLNRLACPLFDAPGFTRALEAAYLEANRLSRARETPVDIVVDGACRKLPDKGDRRRGTQGTDLG